MSDRLIRDELLDSDRYVDLPSDTAGRLFVHFVLKADDLGNAEATTSRIRRLLPRHRDADDATIEGFLQQLVDADLVRTYEAGGKRYVHIPRFRQRLRSFKRANPLPPAEIECSEMKELRSHLSVNCATDDRRLTDTRRTLAAEVKGREVIKQSGNKKNVPPAKVVDNSERKASAPIPIGQLLNGNSKPGAAWFMSPEGIKREAAREGISSPPGEAVDDLKTRIFAVKAARQRNAQ